MKKAFIYIAMAGLLFMSSCVHELVPSDRSDWKGTGTTLKLDAKVTDSPKTKANTRPGDDDGSYNENKDYTLDYFIFDVDPASNVTTSAKIQGRFTFSDGAISPKSVDVSEEFDDDNNTCYVYAIANLPDATTSPNNYFEVNADGKLQHVVVSTTTTTTVLDGNYQTLQAIEIVTDFKNSLEGGQFKAQKSFVMAGLSEAITLAGDGGDEADVDLSRIASKISLDINVIKMIEQYTTNNVTQTEEYQGTWFPNIDHIQIYLNYVNPAGLVSGTYENRVYQIGSYFSYERYAYKPTVDPNGSYTTTTLARYQDTDATKPYYNVDLAGTIVVDGDGNPVFVDGTEYPAFEVTGTPFYSYPMTWKTSDATAPFIKIIIPWVKYNVPDHYRNLSPGTDDYNAVIAGANNFPESFTLPDFTIDGTTYHAQANRLTSESAMNQRFGEEFYYKISVPAFLEGETSECALQANKWYMINLDVAVLGSETDDASMTIDGSQMGIYVIDWSSPEDAIGGDIDGGRYLSTAKSEYVINAINELTIPVISSHALTITGYGGSGSPTATYWTRAGGADAGSLTYSTTSSEGVYFTITPATNASSVKLEHKLVPFSTSFTEANNAKDIAKITYKFRIQHSDPVGAADYYKDITVIQYPSIYIETQSSSGRPFIYNVTNGNIVGQSQNGGTGYNNDRFSVGRINSNGQGDLNFTIISVSSLAGLVNTGTAPYKDWVIGDPRIRLGDAYITPSSGEPYYKDDYSSNQQNQADNTRWYRSDLGLAPSYFDNYLVSNKDANNFISPKFMLASGYGYNQSASDGSWKMNSERCAGYQEDGYPAGRWRVPTEAELIFCATLAAKQLMPSPFIATVNYSAASGRYLYYNTSGNTFTGEIQEVNSGLRSIRCVYDLWYWGDEPVSGVQGNYTIKTDQ